MSCNTMIHNDYLKKMILYKRNESKITGTSINVIYVLFRGLKQSQNKWLNQTYGQLHSSSVDIMMRESGTNPFTKQVHFANGFPPKGLLQAASPSHYGTRSHFVSLVGRITFLTELCRCTFTAQIPVPLDCLWPAKNWQEKMNSFSSIVLLHRMMNLPEQEETVTQFRPLLKGVASSVVQETGQRMNDM